MKRVTVTVFGGAIEEKILVEEREEVLIVTTEDEWNAAEREKRAPVVVGFRKEYLVNRY
jgi:hypothetical protein